MTKFEYMHLALDHNKDVMDKHLEVLNSHGNKGWELVSSVYPIEEKDHGDRSIVFFLKREITDQEEK